MEYANSVHKVNILNFTAGDSYSSSGKLTQEHNPPLPIATRGHYYKATKGLGNLIPAVADDIGSKLLTTGTTTSSIHATQAY
jgi:hypothetical protein